MFTSWRGGQGESRQVQLGAVRRDEVALSTCQDTDLCPDLAVLLRRVPGFPEDT